MTLVHHFVLIYRVKQKPPNICCYYLISELFMPRFRFSPDRVMRPMELIARDSVKSDVPVSLVQFISPTIRSHVKTHATIKHRDSPFLQPVSKSQTQPHHVKPGLSSAVWRLGAVCQSAGADPIGRAVPRAQILSDGCVPQLWAATRQPPAVCRPLAVRPSRLMTL